MFAIRVTELVRRMLDHANRAMILSRKMAQEDCHESNDLFWALAKYVENVQDSITTLDNINDKILPKLVEISEQEWGDQKGMRIQLAHKFWRIDPNILWETVTQDFPPLVSLLTKVRIKKDPVNFDKIILKGTKEDFESLVDTDTQKLFTPGHSILFLLFDTEGNPEVIRVGRKGSRQLVLASSIPGLVVSNVIGVRYERS